MTDGILRYSGQWILFTSDPGFRPGGGNLMMKGSSMFASCSSLTGLSEGERTCGDYLAECFEKDAAGTGKKPRSPQTPLPAVVLGEKRLRRHGFRNGYR